MTGFGDEIYRKGIQSGKIEGRREGQILGALMCGKLRNRFLKCSMFLWKK